MGGWVAEHGGQTLKLWKVGDARLVSPWQGWGVLRWQSVVVVAGGGEDWGWVGDLECETG